jgi:energy-converting hydrogenase Eha subunit G
MYSKTFLGFIIFCIIGSGVIIYMTSNKLDNNNYWISSEITGIWTIVVGIAWALSLFLYDRYGDGNMLLAIIWFKPLFRLMFDTLYLIFIIASK